MDPFHYHTVHTQTEPQPQPKHHQEEKCNITTKPHHQNNNSNVSNNCLYRRACTRWIPTSEQTHILRDLYYNHGVRSPNSKEIESISAMLEKYGKIKKKNVFYRFQNYKARNRQKKRLTVEVNGVNMKPNANGLLSSGALTPNEFNMNGNGEISQIQNSNGGLELEIPHDSMADATTY